VLVGLALFWFIMLMALRQRFDTAESTRLLAVVNRARWPHVVIPYSLRLALPWVTWVTLAVLVASGAVMISFRAAPTGAWWWTKMALLGGILLAQLLVTRRPLVLLIRLNFLLVLGAVLVSGFVLRG
jgi:hypothetical protein